MSLNCEIKTGSYACLVCDEKFEHMDVLKIHLLNHSYKVENFVLESVDISEDLELQDYNDLLFIKEEQCLLEKDNPEIEMNEIPPERFKEVHVCSTCGKEFRRKDHLKKHFVTHSDKRPFVCLVCGKDFARKDRFKEHCVIHLCNGWSCYFCGRMFSQRCILRKHEMIHRNVKPFSCELCDRKFSRKNDLLRHGTSHTGEKAHFCDLCGKGFSQKRLVKRHLRIHKKGK